MTLKLVHIKINITNTYQRGLTNMIKGIILSIALLANQNSFIGVAENQHYISNSIQAGGYYIENDLDIHKDDVVAIVDGEVYIIECNH